ncbi:MAG: dienelactone hydrolase family protein [Mycobacterium sp.]
MPTTQETVTTPDGQCRVTFATPDGDGPWPGIVMYPDAGGPRQVFDDMATELASYGYVVLVPDVYYRSGDWAPFDMGTVFSDESERNRLYEMIKSVTPNAMASDAATLFYYLSFRREVDGDKFGTTGYCMGGRASLTVAGRLPGEVAAAMSFHGGGLVSDDPASPHLLADKITAAVYVGGAENDASFTPEHAATLDKALTAAGVEHTIETYSAGHGFAVPDNGPYDEAAARQHWDAMKDFFAKHLRLG